MDSVGWIVDLLTSPATPLYGMLLIVGVMAWRASVQGFPAIILAMVERRRATAAEKAADWQRLREEVKRIAAAEADCHQRLNEALHRIAEMEGYMIGSGKARNDAAAILAAERAEDREKGNRDE